MNAKKSLYLCVGIGALTVGALTFQATSNRMGNFFSVQSTQNYTLSILPEDTPNTWLDTFQNSVTGTFKTSENHDVDLTFVNAKLDDAEDPSEIILAPRGVIHNLNSGNNAITGINGVKFSGSGTLVFRPITDTGGNNLGTAPEVDPTVITPGSEFIPVPVCDYFELAALPNGSNTTINSLSVSYSCSQNSSDVRMLDGTYTGIGGDDSTYKMVISNGSGSIESLDKLENLHLDGTAEMLSKTRVKFTFVYNTYNIFYTMDYDGHSLTFVSKSDEVGGAVAAQVAEVSLDRVYNVEDFESYTATGTGYVSAAAKYTTSGLRANYYADYYTGSSTGEIGGSGWPIMTSTDNSTLLSTKGHNGSKGVAFKFSNGMSMRYISMNELYGIKEVIGKGAYFSFWARGAYTNANFNTDHASDTTMKAYLYYDSPLTPSNQTTVRETFEFTVSAGSTWQHFEFPLTEGRKYYGFGVFSQQSSGSTQYVPFDDFQIYSASPFAEYVPPVAATGVGISSAELDLTTGGHSNLTATVEPNNATNKNVSWESNNTSVATVDSSGYVTAVAPGNATITVTTEDGGFTATCAVTVSAPAVVYPTGSYIGTATVNGNDYSIVLAFGTSENGLIAVRLANTDAVATNVSYNSGTNKFTITTTGSYSSMSFGDITGTYDAEHDQLTGVGCGGTIKTYVSNNNSITATKLDVWDCDGTTQQLQSTFKRRYMSGSWQVDTSNADRITSNTTEFVSGTGSVKRRGYSGGAVALNFNSDFSPAKSVQNVQFWVYNPSANDITLRMWYYQAANFGSNGETGSVVAKAGQWTYLAMGFGNNGANRTIYNFQIADFNNTGVYLSFDNIALF